MLFKNGRVAILALDIFLSGIYICFCILALVLLYLGLGWFNTYSGFSLAVRISAAEYKNGPTD